MRLVEPTPYMLEQAAAHFLEQVTGSDHLLPNAGGEIQHTYRGAEGCGVFFYPDRKFATGTAERACVARFIPIVNRSTHPENSFEFDYVAMERAIRWEYTGAPSGFIQVVHSHLDDSAPSTEDFAMVDALQAGMDSHPIWHATDLHKLFCVPSKRWIDFSSTVAEDTFSASTNQGRL